MLCKSFDGRTYWVESQMIMTIYMASMQYYCLRVHISCYIYIYIYTNGADKYIYILYIHLQNYIPHSIRYHPQMNDVTGLSDHRITCHFLHMFVRRIYSRTLHELRRQILKSLTLAVQRSSKIQVRTSSPVIRCGKPEWFVLFTGAQKTVV